MKCLILTFNALQSSTKVTSHHFTEYLLSLGWKVLYVSDAVSPFHLLKIKRFKTNLNRVINATFSSIDYEQNLVSVTPFALLPVENFFPFQINLCAKLHVSSFSYRLKSTINNFLSGDEFFDLIWINNPKFYELIKNLKYKKLV